MLAEEDEHGLIEDMYIAERRLLGGLALEVDDIGGVVPVLPAALQQTVRQVDILAIHEEVLVEESHLVEGLTTEHEERPADDLDATRLVPRQMAHVIALGEAQHFQTRHPGRGNGPSRLRGQRTIGIVHPHTQTASLRMGIHKADARTEGGLCHDGIGIEQQHVFALSLTDGDVVGAREAEIVVVGNQTDPKVMRADIVDGIIRRGIVDDKHLDAVDTFRRLLYAVEALRHERPHIIADYDNR